MDRQDPVEIHSDEEGNTLTPPRIFIRWPSGDEPDIVMLPTHINHVWVNLAWLFLS